MYRPLREFQNSGGFDYFICLLFVRTCSNNSSMMPRNERLSCQKEEIPCFYFSPFSSLVGRLILMLALLFWPAETVKVKMWVVVL